MNRRQMLLSCLGLVIAPVVPTGEIPKPCTKLVLLKWEATPVIGHDGRMKRETIAHLRLANAGEPNGTENWSQYVPMLPPGYRRIQSVYCLDVTGTELRCKWVDEEIRTQIGERT